MLNIGFDAKRYFLNRTGLGNYSRDLVRMLSTYYPDNNYFLYTPKTSKFLSNVPANVKTVLPSTAIDRLVPNLWRSKRINKDLINNQVSIFHGLSGEIPQGLPKSKIKSLVTVHDLIFLRYPELYKPIDRFIYYKKTKYAVNNADCIIAISQQTKKDIIHFFQIPEDKIQVIYQGCHPAFKKEYTASQKAAVKSKFSLPDRFLLNVGTMEERKNALQIVKAIQDIDIPLIIVGRETAYAEKIKGFLEQSQMKNRVYFLSSVNMEELAIIYSLATLFIYPSKFEGFGIPIIEALFSGVPVITSNSGVFPEAGGPGSLYINPEDTDDISSAINKVLHDEALRKEMIAKGKDFVEKFTDKVIAKDLMDCYLKLF